MTMPDPARLPADAATMQALPVGARVIYHPPPNSRCWEPFRGIVGKDANGRKYIDDQEGDTWTGVCPGATIERLA